MAYVRINKRELTEFFRGNIPGTPGGELHAAAKLLKAEAENNSPVDTGNMKSSITMTEQNQGNYGLKITVKAEAPYSGYNDQGTGPRHEDFFGNPSPRRLKFVRFPTSRRQAIIIMENTEPRGSAPSHFMGRAYETTVRRFHRLFSRRTR